MTKRDPRLLVAFLTSIVSFILSRHAYSVSFRTYLVRDANEQPCEGFAFCSQLELPSTEELLLHGGSFLLLLVTGLMLAWAWFRPFK